MVAEAGGSSKAFGPGFVGVFACSTAISRIADTAQRAGSGQTADGGKNGASDKTADIDSMHCGNHR
jgi:hypothetical protein